MNACSPKEELEWRKHIQARVCKDYVESFDHATFSVLTLGVKSLGTVFGKPGRFSLCVLNATICIQHHGDSFAMSTY